jgi:hypothetical protein
LASFIGLGQSFTVDGNTVELALTSALVFEISQLQSAQDRVVLDRTNATIVRSEHYEPVAMRDPRPQKRLAGSTQWCCANFVEISVVRG